MTLHNAIEQLLKLNGSMTTQQIADKLNFNKWYKKKDTAQSSKHSRFMEGQRTTPISSAVTVQLFS